MNALSLYSGGAGDELTHFSLFSGIGGIDLAAEWAGFKTVGQCEWADYPIKVLEKHWPDVPRWRDIRDVTAKSFREHTGLSSPTLISGGFPCQPHSCAGKRLASADERDLWGEFARVIREIRPKWVLGENVPGLLPSENGRFFGGILRDLAGMGYDAEWCSLRASWVGAIHRRERVFIIAHNEGEQDRRLLKQQLQSYLNAGDNIATTNPNKQRLQGQLFAEEQQKANEQSERMYLHLLRYADEKHLSESAILRKSNGVPARVDRSKCLGNAVVPQQAYPILAVIAELTKMSLIAAMDKT